MSKPYSFRDSSSNLEDFIRKKKNSSIFKDRNDIYIFDGHHIMEKLDDSIQKTAYEVIDWKLFTEMFLTVNEL